MTVAGLAPEGGADGEYDAAETIGPILVRDKAEAWRLTSGALIWREFSLGSTNGHAAALLIVLLKLKLCACPVTNNVQPEVLEVHLLLPGSLSSGFRRGRR